MKNFKAIWFISSEFMNNFKLFWFLWTRYSKVPNKRRVRLFRIYCCFKRERQYCLFLQVYECSGCYFDKMVKSWKDHFGQRTASSPTYIVFELYLIWYISPVANFGTHPLCTYFIVFNVNRLFSSSINPLSMMNM